MIGLSWSSVCLKRNTWVLCTWNKCWLLKIKLWILIVIMLSFYITQFFKHVLFYSEIKEATLCSSQKKKHVRIYVGNALDSFDICYLDMKRYNGEELWKLKMRSASIKQLSIIFIFSCELGRRYMNWKLSKNQELYIKIANLKIHTLSFFILLMS